MLTEIKYCFNTKITIICIIIIIKIINIVIIKIAQTSIKIGTFRLIFHEDYHMSRGDV